MKWTLYEIVFRLRAPMHIGCGRVGNMLRTNPYVTGRVFWGALCQQLTRYNTPVGQPAIDSREYRKIGEQIHSSLVFTYFYPATRSRGGGWDVAWFWKPRFNARFLNTYATTALSYPSHTAEDGSLHEVEFISSNAMDNGQRVYLIGYVAENGEFKDWKEILNRLQFGGERCYGWGRVAVVDCSQMKSDLSQSPVLEYSIFNGMAAWVQRDDDRPHIKLTVSETLEPNLLAHTHPNGISAKGNIEPLVGREWRSDNSQNRYAGQHVAFSGNLFRPGSQILATTVFDVGNYGLWRKAD